jgi:DNA (cytosine-5)-methyltransferase 1
VNELALFAGAGGGILGGHLLGWRTICAVEWEPYAACILAARQNDGLLPPFPIWDDIQTFDGNPWRGIVDVVSGGFPCSDISCAGRGAGIEGEKSGMWREMARVIREVRPRFVFVENTPMLTSRGLGRVLGDLAALGFDAQWGVLGAAEVGAPHQRDRIWIVGLDRHADRIDERTEQKIARHKQGTYAIRVYQEVAHSNHMWQSQPQGSERDQRGWVGNSSGTVPNPDQAGLQERNWRTATGGPLATPIQCDWWDSEPDVGRVAHGVAARLDRLKALGNGQVPIVAAQACDLLMK